MKSTIIFSIILSFIATLCCPLVVVAQNPFPPSRSIDTLRVIQIIQGQSLREKIIDSITSIETIAGKVILKEGVTIFHCDSASINKRTNILEAFGNIHINQNDSIHTYSQYLKYIGKERIAFLKKDVRLTDNKGTLYTQDFEYDLTSSIGKYRSGGRVVNGKTVLTSMEAVYYGETKDVFFKKNVHLVDPKYDMRNDTLLYNTQTQITSWSTPTTIKSKNGGDIYSSNGTYDLKNGKAFFGNRTVIQDSNRTYVADNSAYDEVTGIAQLEGNAIIKDSVNGYSVLGNQIYLDKNNNSFLATRKPVLIFKGEGNDSTFIAADTLFSGVEKRDSLGRKIVISKDTLKKVTVIEQQDSLLVKGTRNDSSQIKTLVKNEPSKDTLSTDDADDFFAMKKRPEKKLPGQNKPSMDSVIKKPGIINAPDSFLVKKDSLANKPSKKNSDSVLAKPGAINTPDSFLVKKDTQLNKSFVNSKPGKDSVSQVQSDSLFANQHLSDSANNKAMLQEEPLSQEDTLYKTTGIKATKDTAIRYFIAFHNVRIFNDSLQAVCDSLYYSSADSIFRLFQEPLVFSNNSQIAGDTIYLYTKNKKAERIYVFENGIIINKANDQIYNQISGRTLNGYFKGGELDYMRAKGSPAESVYYPQDEDSSYTGMNRAKGDVIDIYFLNKEVNKVKFINEVDGTLYPIRHVPEDQKFLKNYKWLDKRRPKNKLELFE